MYFSSSKTITIRVFIGALIIFTLTGCTNSTPSQTPTSAGTSPTTANPTANQVQSVSSLNHDTSFNLSSLNIQAKALACPLDNWLYQHQIKYSGGNVTLPDPGSSFDAGAIANLAASIDQDNPSLLPNGFTTVLAGLVDPGNQYAFSCYSDWEVTNTSQDVVQINQIALLYTANSQPNTSHYNLIDICSLPRIHEKEFCYAARGGTGGPQIYSFLLTTGSSGTIVASQETQPFTIMPGATVEVELQIKPSDASNSDYIYSLVPQLTLSTSQPQTLSQLTSSVVFVNNGQLSCYQLQSGNTFSQMNNPTIPYYNPTAGSGSIATECV